MEVFMPSPTNPDYMSAAEAVRILREAERKLGAVAMAVPNVAKRTEKLRRECDTLARVLESQLAVY
jgi:hypothetical protein